MAGGTRELLTLLWRQETNMWATCKVPMEGYRDNHRPEEGGGHWRGYEGPLSHCQGLQVDRDERLCSTM